MDQNRENAFQTTPLPYPRAALWLCALASLVIWVAFSKFSIRIHNDDAMRLIQVRDLLAGQGWFDLTQTRLGLEGGTAMHWSRLVDAPIAGMLLLLTPLLGSAQAEAAVMILWPGLLFAATIYALAAICQRLGGHKATIYGVILASILVAQSGKFDPGSLDHHNVQIMLLTVALAGFVYRRRNDLYAALSGAALALSIGVGIETLPLIAVICAGFAIVWAWRGGDEHRATMLFAMALLSVLGLVFWGTADAAARAGGFCDALSRDLVIPAMIGAVGLAGLSIFGSAQTRSVRFIGLAGLAGFVVVATVSIAPACLSNPLDMLDPVLKEKWLSRVVETRSLAEFSNDRLGFFAGGFMGLLIALYFMVRDPRWDAWVMLAAVIAASLLLTAYQSRGFPIMATLSVLPTALLASRLGDMPSVDGKAWSGLVTLCAVILSVPAFTSAVVLHSVSMIRPSHAAPMASPVDAAPRAPENPATGIPCTYPQDFAALAALPAGTVSAPPYFGAYILMNTPHRVLSAPYHRNEAGMLAQLDLAYASPKTTHDLLKKYGVDYVVTCDADEQFAGENPGLSSHLAAGLNSGDLTRVAAPGPLTIHRVKH